MKHYIREIKRVIWLRYSSLKFKLIFSFKYRKAKNKKRKTILLTATPEHGNLGDHAIVYAEYRILNKTDFSLIEIRNSEYLNNRNWLQKKVDQADIIVIDGGGNLGTLWPNEDDKISDIISRFNQNKVIIFPQTCYYDQNQESMSRLEKNRKIYSDAKDLTIMIRDRISYDFMRDNFPKLNCIFCPDIVLSINQVEFHESRKGVLLCFRKDREKIVDEKIEDSIKRYLHELNIPFRETSTIINKKVTNKNRNQCLADKWEEFARAKLVITDRLHAMVFSAITGTPCIAIDNQSKKVGGTYEWIKELKYILYLDDPEQIISSIEKCMGSNQENIISTTQKIIL